MMFVSPLVLYISIDKSVLKKVLEGCPVHFTRRLKCGSLGLNMEPDGAEGRRADAGLLHAAVPHHDTVPGSDRHAGIQRAVENVFR